MIKTDITDDICLITISCNGKIIDCLNTIKKELNQRNIKAYYSSALNFSSKNKSIIVAIGENDLYPWLSLISCIKDKTEISGCTINSYNTLICWDKSAIGIFDIVGGYEDNIRLIYENCESGCIICESEVKHKIVSKIDTL